MTGRRKPKPLTGRPLKLHSLGGLVVWRLHRERRTRDRTPLSPWGNRLGGLVVKASASGAEDPGSNPVCAGIFSGRVIPVTSKLALQWLPYQAPGIIEGCRFSVIFLFFPLFLARSVLRRSVSRFFPQLFRLYVNILYFLLFHLSLSELSVSFVFIFCETARTCRFSVIFAKFQWPP